MRKPVHTHTLHTHILHTAHTHTPHSTHTLHTHILNTPHTHTPHTTHTHSTQHTHTHTGLLAEQWVTAVGQCMHICPDGVQQFPMKCAGGVLFIVYLFQMPWVSPEITCDYLQVRDSF